MGMPYTVLMPIFAKDILGGGPHTLGFLVAMAGVGALLSALYLASRKSVVGLGTDYCRTSSGIFGCALVFFSFSRSVPLLPFNEPLRRLRVYGGYHVHQHDPADHR